jgi:hypothetical protein
MDGEIYDLFVHSQFEIWRQNMQLYNTDGALFPKFNCNSAILFCGNGPHISLRRERD